ncbi:unnamed protein product [Protopolystoma xenopodis]|uniref:Uncharacterized protein n=1 Tax=Protopolystoma xenopodis TaxID=117903 RepID=A0A3S5A3U7_9PLAT|nr:unnamed protein product [Protopolystoma xenopodis]
MKIPAATIRLLQANIWHHLEVSWQPIQNEGLKVWLDGQVLVHQVAQTMEKTTAIPETYAYLPNAASASGTAAVEIADWKVEPMAEGEVHEIESLADTSQFHLKLVEIFPASRWNLIKIGQWPEGKLLNSSNQFYSFG